MERLSIEACRELIDGGDSMSDDQIEALRDELYVLADVVTGLWDGLDTMDQSLLQPPGDVWEQINEDTWVN